MISNRQDHKHNSDNNTHTHTHTHTHHKLQRSLMKHRWRMDWCSTALWSRSSIKSDEFFFITERFLCCDVRWRHVNCWGQRTHPCSEETLETEGESVSWGPTKCLDQNSSTWNPFRLFAVTAPRSQSTAWKQKQCRSTRGLSEGVCCPSRSVWDTEPDDCTNKLNWQSDGKTCWIK